MVKPVSDRSKYTLAITQLLSGIRSYSDEDFEADRAPMNQQ